MSWIRITNVNNLPLREGRKVVVDDRELAVFHLGNGQYAAVDNACPHRGGPLCDGIVTGHAVVCPLHAWKVDLETGNVLKPDVCVRTLNYEVQVEDGVLTVFIPDNSRKDLAA